MKILIIGTGGTGGCIGGYLARQGEDVTFIARGKHLETIKDKGLRVKSARTGDFTVYPVKACIMEDYREVPDIVFVCVKYHSLGEAICFLERAADTHTIVIPILNVYGTGGKMQPRLKCRVLDGCVYIFSMIEAPGVICQPTEIFRLYFGLRKTETGFGKTEDGNLACDSEQMEARFCEIEAMLNKAGIEAHYSENIERDALQKFSFVSPIGAAGLYYSGSAGDFMEAGEKREMFLNLVREVERVGTAMGLEFETDLSENADRILQGLTPGATTSMQRDVIGGGKSEVDGLVHEMVRLGDRYGVDVPSYRLISEWVKAKGIQ